MTRSFKIFLSAVTSENGTARARVASDLRARGLTAKVQGEFRQEAGSETTLGKLHDYIQDCDAVVSVLGERSGRVPPPAAAEPYAELLPEGFERLSYTQWELVFARNFERRLSIYVADPEVKPDRPEAGEDDEPELQKRFRDYLFEHLDLDRTPFANPDALRAEVLREEWPRVRPDKPFSLPYASLGPLFKGRGRFLERLHERLAATPDGRATAIAGKVVHGLGGVGKTRLAVEYAWRHLDDYTAVLFVPAETPQLLRQSLAGFTGSEVLDLPQQAQTEEEAQVEATLRWLRDHPGWLLIFDNLDTPEAAEAAEALLARLQGGQALFTGRLTQWSAAVEPLELDLLELEDAVSFLLERTERGRRRAPSDETDAEEVARELGGLALALEQAAAYIAHRRISFADYLAEWRSQALKVTEWYDDRVMNYPHSLAVTWETTVGRLDAGAVALLRILAWLAPEPVPLFLFDTEEAEPLWREAIDLLAEEGGESPDADGDLRDALAALADYSMIRWDVEAESVTVHRVVQEVWRTRLPEDSREMWLRAALLLLDDALQSDPTDVRKWAVWVPLLPHAAFTCDEAVQAAIVDPTARLLGQLGRLFLAKAEHAEAGPLLYLALKIDEIRHGPEHPEVAIDLNNLASLLQDTNRLDEAEPLFRRALEIDEASFGPQHPRVAIGLNNLAGVLDKTNRRDEAEPLMRRALEIDESTYGPQDHTVAQRLNNLAQLLADTNRRDEAEPLMRRALAIDEAIYGPDDPNVAVVLNNLAQLLEDTDRRDEAEPLMRRALEIDEASYGPEHPRVAIHLNNLAQLLGFTNRLDEAEPLMRRALEIDEANYGRKHPKVAIRLNNLAALLQVTGRLAEAQPLSRRQLEIFVDFRRRTGHEHPHLRTAIENYYDLLREMGRSEADIKAELKSLVAAQFSDG